MRQFSLRTRILNFLRRPFQFAPIERLLVGWTNGRRFSGVISKVPANHYQYPPLSLRHVSRHGLALDLDISDLIQWYLYFGFRDPSLEALQAVCKQGFTVFDVGANIGMTALPISKIVGETGTVFAFEPDPDSFRKCQDHIERNAVRNVHLSSLALSDQRGNATLVSPEDSNKGMNRIGNGPGLSIETHTIDGFIEEHALARLDLLKIDVEGSELAVLKGGIRTLRRDRPILFVELDNALLSARGTSARELLEWLDEIGYLIVRADDGSTVTARERLDGCHFDMICTAVHLRAA